MTRSNLLRFIIESNRIENIDDIAIASDQLHMYENFLELDELTEREILLTQSLIAPGRGIRDTEGRDVRVGQHVPPPGGPHITEALRLLIQEYNACEDNYPELHFKFEQLHPFMDGNGRMGRLLWLWHHTQNNVDHVFDDRSLLHQWYYESLTYLGQLVK